MSINYLNIFVSFSISNDRLTANQKENKFLPLQIHTFPRDIHKVTEQSTHIGVRNFCYSRAIESSRSKFAPPLSQPPPSEAKQFTGERVNSK